jgi:dipeptidyl aminopeptidase/acylaminoacyl peptidase
MKKLIYLPFLIAALFLSCTTKRYEENTTSKRGFSNNLTEKEIAFAKITPEILWKFGRVSDAQLSPDGKTVIYGISSFNIDSNKKNTDIYSVDISTKVIKQLTNFPEEETNQRWFPDGSKIGFLSLQSGSSQIWEISPSGRELKQISNIKGGVNSFEYSPKGDQIYYTADVKLEKKPTEIYPDLPLANVKIIDNLMYRHWNAWHNYTYSHIFVASYKDGQVSDPKDIMKDEAYDSPLSPFFDNTEITWSPDGKTIAYTCKKLIGKDYAVSTNSDIYLYDITSGTTVNLTDGMPGYDRYPVFSPDGKKIAWQSMETPGYESDQMRLFVYSFDNKEKKYLTKGFDQNAEHFVWNSASDKIYFVSGIHATYQVYCADLKSEVIKPITKGWHDYTSLCYKGNTLVGERMSMSQANEIFKIDENTGEENQLTYTNQKIYDKIKLGKVEEKWIKTTDNKKMLVWVIYPPDFGSTKKYPALLYCEGGPQEAVSQFFSFRWNFQIMAANGYIIIAPNRRGLPTFGKKWNDQIAGDYGGQNMKDYLSAVDALKKEPYIDGERLGAVGASYGAYSVYWLAGHHHKRFKAFIAHCGMFNLESQYAETEEMFFVNHDLGGPFWKTPKPKSYEFSPHRFVQNWDTPILIVTGANDFRIPYTESFQAFNAAQLMGIPSKLLFFPDESHFIQKPQNSILWQREFFAWLDKWLKK